MYIILKKIRSRTETDALVNKVISKCLSCLDNETLTELAMTDKSAEARNGAGAIAQDDRVY